HSIDSAAPASATSTNATVPASSHRKTRSLRASRRSRAVPAEAGRAMAFMCIREKMCRHARVDGAPGSWRARGGSGARTLDPRLREDVATSAARAARPAESLEFGRPVRLDLLHQFRRQRHVVQFGGLRLAMLEGPLEEVACGLAARGIL